MGIFAKVSGEWKSVDGCGSAGLPGLGGWADPGIPETDTYKDDDGITWKLWVITATTTLTFADTGVLDVLVVGGGGSGRVGGNANGGNGGGDSGLVNSGITQVKAGPSEVIIGAGGVPGATKGGDTSAFGYLSVGRADRAYSNGTGSGAGSGASGIWSSITGEDVEYGKGAQYNSGAGVEYGDAGGSGKNGKQGVVIIRTAVE